MILFMRDWDYYPRAIPHVSTKNKSFLDIAGLYKAMGVKNHYFPLALHNPDLEHVNVFDENLTAEEKTMVLLEASNNPWYFIRECVRIPGLQDVRFHAHRGNIALFWAFFNHIDIALIQPRQTYKSVSTDCLMINLMYLSARRTNILMFTKDDGLRKKNVQRLKDIRGALPKYIVPHDKRLDANNQHELTCKRWENHYITGVAQTSEDAADKLGRGFTSPVQHYDEAPFIRYIRTTIPASLAAGIEAKDQAKRFNKPYGTIYTTTAGKKDDPDGKYMYDLIHSGAIMNEKLYDATDMAHAHRLVVNSSRSEAPLINATFNHRQLGRTDAWMYRILSETKAVGEGADRDMFNRWTSGSQKSPLSTQLNEIIRLSELDPLHVDITEDDYILNWYIPEEEIPERLRTGIFAAGLDTSDATGRDDIALVIQDLETMETVATGVFNETNLILFGVFIGKFMVKYTSVVLIPERRSTGTALGVDAVVLALIGAGMDPFRRIYNLAADKPEDHREIYQLALQDLNRRPKDLYDKTKKLFGLATSASSREALYGRVLLSAAKNGGHGVKDVQLVRQITGLVMRNGRIDHALSGNDDMVIAWLLCHWFVTETKNLDFYGIDSRRVMSKAKKSGRNETFEQRIERQEQEGYKAEIASLLTKLEDTEIPHEVATLTASIKRLSGKITGEEYGLLTIDAAIKKANEERYGKLGKGRARRIPLDLQARPFGRR